MLALSLMHLISSLQTKNSIITSLLWSSQEVYKENGSSWLESPPFLSHSILLPSFASIGHEYSAQSYFFNSSIDGSIYQKCQNT